MADDKVIRDPQLYREMCVPFPDTEATQIAVDAFYEDVRESRRKHKIPDVLVVIRFTTMVDGVEMTAYLTGNNGNPLECEPMAAFALAESGQKRMAIIAEAQRSARKTRNAER